MLLNLFCLLWLIILLCLTTTPISVSSITAPSCVIGFRVDDGVAGGFINVTGTFQVDINSFNATESSYLLIPTTVFATGSGPASYQGLYPGKYFTNDNKLFNVTATSTGVIIQSGFHVDFNGLGLVRTPQTKTGFNQSILIFNDISPGLGSPSGISIKDQAFLFSGPAAATFNLTGCTTGVTGTGLAVGGTGGTVQGDPQFVGLRGQSYQVHGLDGEVYNIITQQHLQVNARFVFLNSGKCPVVDGKATSSCWSHPGSYLGEIGIQQMIGGVLQQINIKSGSAGYGFSELSLNNQSMAVAAKYQYEQFSVWYNSSHEIHVNSPLFAFELTNSDLFINLAMKPKVSLSRLDSHGLFGQTHQDEIYQSQLKYIEGEVDHYVVRDRDIFGKEFMYNKFH